MRNFIYLLKTEYFIRRDLFDIFCSINQIEINMQLLFYYQRRLCLNCKFIHI